MVGALGGLGHSSVHVGLVWEGPGYQVSVSCNSELSLAQVSQLLGGQIGTSEEKITFVCFRLQLISQSDLGLLPY